MLAVPTSSQFDYGKAAGRTVTNHLRFVPMVWRASLREYNLIHANYGLTAPTAVLQSNLSVVLSQWGTDTRGRYGAVSYPSLQCANAVGVSVDSRSTDT